MCLFHLRRVLHDTEVALEVGRANRRHLLSPFGNLACHLPEDAGDLALQIAHPRFPGVVGGDVVERVVGQGDVLLGQSMLLHLLWKEELAGNFHLFLGRVARKLDHLHPVAQRGNQRVDLVGRRDEHHVRQIVRHAQVVIGKGGVLLRVEHLQKGGGGIAPEVEPHFVDLVEHEKRIIRLRLLHPLQNPSGEGADVGPPVAPDFGFVADAAQGDSDKLAPHRPRDRASHRGLADPRRADKAENRPLHLPLALHLPDGQIFENPLLDLQHAVMIFVEHHRRLFQIDPILRRGVPRQLDHPFQMGEKRRRLGRFEVHSLQAFDLLFGFFGDLLRHLRGGDPLANPLHLVAPDVALSELFLDRLDLFAQEIVALRFVHLLPRVRVDFMLDGQDVNFFGQNGADLAETKDGVFGLQHLLGDLQLCVDVGGDQVGQTTRVVHLFDDRDELRHERLAILSHFLNLLLDHSQGRLGLDVDRHRFRFQERRQ